MSIKMDEIINGFLILLGLIVLALIWKVCSTAIELFKEWIREKRLAVVPCRHAIPGGSTRWKCPQCRVEEEAREKTQLEIDLDVNAAKERARAAEKLQLEADWG